MKRYGVCPYCVLCTVAAWADSSKPAAAGLLLWARWAGDMDRLLHDRRSAAAASECGQCHVASCTHRLVSAAGIVTRWLRTFLRGTRQVWTCHGRNRRLDDYSSSRCSCSFWSLHCWTAKHSWPSPPKKLTYCWNNTITNVILNAKIRSLEMLYADFQDVQVLVTSSWKPHSTPGLKTTIFYCSWQHGKKFAKLNTDNGVSKEIGRVHVGSWPATPARN